MALSHRSFVAGGVIASSRIVRAVAQSLAGGPWRGLARLPTVVGGYMYVSQSSLTPLDDVEVYYGSSCLAGSGKC